MPSTSTRMPVGAFAICLITATVPTRFRSSARGSSRSPLCRRSSTIRSPASARLIASMDTGRPTPSGATVIGRTTVSRSGTTGSSEGSGGVCGAVVETSVSAMVHVIEPSLSDIARRVAIGCQPDQARRQLGDALQFCKVNPPRVVIRGVIVGMQAGRQKDCGYAVLQKRPVVGTADQVLRVAVVVLLDGQVNRLVGGLGCSRQVRRVRVAEQMDHVGVL